MELRKNKRQNEEQFIWRLGQAKDSGVLDMDWTGIADVVNAQCREDESEYRTEAAYRKPYQQAKRFYEAGVFNEYTDDSYIEELRDAKQDLQRQKMKLQDERTALNRKLRNQARTETDVDYLTKLIEHRGFANLPKFIPTIASSDNDMVICISDFHLGSTYDNFFGSYDSEIAAQRLSKYLYYIGKVQRLHNSANAYVLLLGDICNGNIHLTTQLQNRENLIEQVQTAAEMLSAFVYEISKIFNTVYVNSVAGNHSRIGLKDNVLRDERLDDLIPWYMKAELKHITNIEFIECGNYDPTIGCVDIRGNRYFIVHGDYDSFDANGVSKLVMMTGTKPKAVFMGHKHRNSFDDASGVKIIRSGSFAGTGDDYCVSKRIYGTPGQMVSIIDSNGIRACYPIEL